MAEVPRRFQLVRDVDVSGVSGTGVVADGVRLADGSAVVCWRGPKPSTVVWREFAHAEQVHGHGGATRFVWDDSPLDLVAVGVLMDHVRTAGLVRDIVGGTG